MKKFINDLLAIFFPWVILLINDNLGGAFLCIVLQASIIGWIPASYWAWKICHPKPHAVESKKTTEPPKQQ